MNRETMTGVSSGTVEAWVASVDALLDGHQLDLAVSADAMRWAPGYREQPALRLPTIDLESLETAMASIHADYLRWAEACRPHIERWAAAVGHACKQIQTLADAVPSLVPYMHAAPSDPRDRALWLRQNRDTGPTRPGMDGRLTRGARR